MDDRPGGHFPRKAVRAVLARFGVTHAWRATPLDPTEEAILLAPADLASVDERALRSALMEVLPHRKVWVLKAGGGWDGEPL